MCMKTNLKKLRKDKGLTQIALQMATGIEQALLSKFENGERVPPTETLMHLRIFIMLAWTTLCAVPKTQKSTNRSADHHSAGYFLSCTSRGLGHKIVRVDVYNNRSADYFGNSKSIGQKSRKCRTVYTEQRRHIPCVVWVGTVIGIIMPLSI